jgi:micrococcal nuclease
MGITRLVAFSGAALTALILTAAFTLVQPAAPAGAAEARTIRVFDGDTIQDTTTDTTYRIVNIDTPEAGRGARCAAERALADRATRRTRSLIAAAANVETRATSRIDQYGRTIAFVAVDGRDLGQILIAEGLARPWRGRREPWCSAQGGLIP